MHIVHYLKWMHLREGGTVRAVLDLCAALADHGHRVTLLTADDTDVPASWKLPSTDPARTANTPICLKVRIRDRLTELLLRKTAEQVQRDTPTQLLDAPSKAIVRNVLKDADCLHLHGPWASSNIQLAAIARSMHVRYVVSPHGMLDDWCMARSTAKKKIQLALAGRRMLEGAAAVHCTAQAELDQSKKWFPNGTGRVVPLVFDTTPFQTLPGPDLARNAYPCLRSDRPTILFLSRLNEKKGPDRLLRAVGVLNQQGRRVNCILAGPADPPAYEQGLRTLATQLGLAIQLPTEGSNTHPSDSPSSCAFLGLVTGATKLSLYQAADVFVLPTSQENWGYVILEAMACGAPTITTRGVDLWPELESSGGAMVLASDNHKSIAEAIGGLLENPGTRHGLSRAGRDWVLGTMNPARTIELFEKIYGLSR